MKNYTGIKLILCALLISTATTHTRTWSEWFTQTFKLDQAESKKLDREVQWIKKNPRAFVNNVAPGVGYGLASTAAVGLIYYNRVRLRSYANKLKDWAGEKWKKNAPERFGGTKKAT